MSNDMTEKSDPYLNYATGFERKEYDRLEVEMTGLREEYAKLSGRRRLLRNKLCKRRRVAKKERPTNV